MNYGIELEFFVADGSYLPVPAYKVTHNLDGNPVIGEIRTDVHSNIVDCVFELQKLLYLEKERLKQAGFVMYHGSEVKVPDEFLQSLRKDKTYVNSKHVEVLEELSIYPKGKVGKLLPRGVYKASLQINFSNNREFTYPTYEKITVEDKYRFQQSSEKKSYAGMFDYVSIIRKLDEVFAEDIAKTKRVKGVYAIKEGKLGDRIEYRSLPSTVYLNKIIETLQ